MFTKCVTTCTLLQDQYAFTNRIDCRNTDAAWRQYAKAFEGKQKHIPVSFPGYKPVAKKDAGMFQNSGRFMRDMDPIVEPIMFEGYTKAVRDKARKNGKQYYFICSCQYVCSPFF